MTEMKGRVLVSLSSQEWNKQQVSRRLAFMMSWHPRLGIDSSIRWYVPKDVAKMIALNLRMSDVRRTTGYSKLDGLRFGLQPRCSNKDNCICDGLCTKEVRIRNPKYADGQKITIQSPRMVLAEDFDQSNFRFLESEQFSLFLFNLGAKIFLEVGEGFTPNVPQMFPADKNILYHMRNRKGHYEIEWKLSNAKQIINRKTKKGCKISLMLELRGEEWVVNHVLLQ